MKLATLFTNLIGGSEGYRAQMPPPPQFPIDPLHPSDLRDREEGDQITMSQDAAFYLASREFNPARMTPSENRHMAELLFDAGAINQRDYAILESAPLHQRSLSGSHMPRNYLADWQMRLAGSMGSSDLATVNEASRALSILGRVASMREEAA